MLHCAIKTPANLRTRAIIPPPPPPVGLSICSLAHFFTPLSFTSLTRHLRWLDTHTHTHPHARVRTVAVVLYDVNSSASWQKNWTQQNVFLDQGPNSEHRRRCVWVQFRPTPWRARSTWLVSRTPYPPRVRILRSAQVNGISCVFVEGSQAISKDKKQSAAVTVFPRTVLVSTHHGLKTVHCHVLGNQQAKTGAEQHVRP
jgi:hypothetical protein